MKLSSQIWLACLVPGTVFALVGIDVNMYDPTCAWACRSAISSNMLSCSDHHASGGHMDMHMDMTSPQCRAGDTAFLTTLAYCMSSKCAQYQIALSRLEKYWEEQCTGDPTVPPKWSYGAALQHVTEIPTRQLGKEDDLNFTAVVSEPAWRAQYGTDMAFEADERTGARYGIALLVSGFGAPIVLTILGFLPFMTGILDKMKPYLVYPSAVGTYQVRPLPFSLGNVPTVGQSFYIFLMVIFNIILTAVNYKTTRPFVWYETQHQEILGLVMFRTGILGFSLFPLTILFAGRNNILLWLTNWSHSTYLLLHRWVARLFAVQVLLHSILALRLYISTGSYSEEQKLPYWIWGAVATVAVSIMVVGSGLYVRRWSYEIFLISHIVLAVIVVVGCWYHVIIRFQRKWGYEMWMYATCAVWFFDRLMRVLRMLKTGVRRAKVADIGDGFVRVDVQGIRWSAVPGQHVYAYFPTMNPLRPWENHPFSVLPTAMLRSSHHSIDTADSDTGSSTNHTDSEKQNNTTISTKPVLQAHTSTGLTLFIRKSSGMTKSLKAHDSLLTLLDGPYPNNPTKAILQCDRLLLIGGGIGITGLLPWVTCHSNAKLCWSVKQTAECLLDAMSNFLGEIREKDVKVGRRVDVREVLGQEVQSGWARIGVVVCGPGGLCDDVRSAVTAAGKKEKTVFELQVDAYSW